MNRQTFSPSREDRRSVDSKRGVFTSINPPQQKPSVIPYLNTSLQGIRESLDDIKNINSSFQLDKSSHIQNQRNTSPITNHYKQHHNQTHPNIGPIHNIHFQQVHNRSTTPQKVKFNYMNQNPQNHQHINSQTVIQNGSQQHINYVPIIEGPQVRRTFVPLQIKNQVPAKIVINSLNQTPPYRNYQASESIAQKDEAYEILIRQYEKLYGALMKQAERNKNLQNLIEKKNAQSSQIIKQQLNNINQGHQFKNPRQQETQRPKRRKLSLDLQQLHNLFAKIYQKSVKDIINSRKQAAKSRIGELFESGRKEISSVSVESVERTFTYQRI